nr:GNAT family N-acetyltransferase [Paenibacillus herberti]
MEQYREEENNGNRLEESADSSPVSEELGRKSLQVVQALNADAGMEEELSRLFHHYRQFYGHPDTQEQRDDARLFIQERLQWQDSIILVAIFGDERIGFAQLYPVFSSLSMRRAWILNDLYIDENWRGQGAARKLPSSMRGTRERPTSNCRQHRIMRRPEGCTSPPVMCLNSIF